ncbi:MAG: oligosaccharide flippase family protein [Phycisphaerae bacterium]|nr:oligosaccharide flippase family protein [Phycisphaerae bacterium]
MSTTRQANLMPADRAAAVPPAPLLSEAGTSSPKPDGGTIRARAVRGSIWTILGYGTSQVLRLAGNVVLARLLVPEAFGLMTLVNVVLQGLQMFSDVGIGPSIIQNRRGDDPAFLNTAWTVQVIRGGALWVAACVLAVPLASFYEQPELAALLPAAGLFALATGFNSTALFIHNRNLALGRLTMLELLAQALGLTVTIVWAVLHPTVWALVAGTVLGGAIRMTLSHLLLPGVPCRLRWDSQAARELVHFGRWIFLSTLTTFLAAQSDKLIFAKTIPFAMLGVYGIAFLFATMPTQVIVRIGSSVVFPAYSRVVREGGNLPSAYVRARRPLLLVGAALITLTIASGPYFVRSLYKPEFHAAGGLMQLLAVMAWFQILECTNGSALLATGRPSWVAAGNFAKLVGLIALIPLGFGLYGFYGAVGGLVLAEACRYLVSATAVRRIGLPGIGADVPFIFLTAGAAAAGVVLASGLTRTGLPDAAVFLLVGATGAAAWAIALYRMPSVRRMFAS